MKAAFGPERALAVAIFGRGTLTFVSKFRDKDFIERSISVTNALWCLTEAMVYSLQFHILPLQKRRPVELRRQDVAKDLQPTPCRYPR